jgi:hypothetical protein
VWNFQDYLENDGRHHFWIMAQPDYHSIIYDNHDILYAYGPLDEYRKILTSQGFSEGVFQFPAPHHHCYNVEFDQEEARILGYWDWEHFPLQPRDYP